MADITFNEILHTDLRDSGGHAMKVLEITGLSGTYTYGGVKIDPADIGFDEITYLAAPGAYPIPYAQPGPWIVGSFVSIININAGIAAGSPTPIGVSDWRMLILTLITSPSTAVAEIPDGTTLALPYGGIQLFAIGA